MDPTDFKIELDTGARKDLAIQAMKSQRRKHKKFRLPIAHFLQFTKCIFN